MTDSPNPSRILVGVDGSESSIEALRQAAKIASAFNAPVEAIITWEYPSMAGGYYAITDWSPEEDAQTILAQTVEKAFGDTPPVDVGTKVLRGGAARVLIEESKQAGMLVLGSRGHGGFAGLLLGSVSAACAAHADCPVLITHSPKAAASPAE